MLTMPERIKERLIDGVPVITILNEEEMHVVIDLLDNQIVNGDWLVEYGCEKGVSYTVICMEDTFSIENNIKAIGQFVKNAYESQDTGWWIGIIPLKDWEHTIKDREMLKQLDPPEKLLVFTYEYMDEDGNTTVPNPMLCWTTPIEFCKRLVNMGRLSGINIISKYILRKDLEARPTMPFVSDFVREAFNIAPYRYWKGKQNG